MIQKRLFGEIEQVAARLRRWRLRIALSCVWILSATAGAAALALNWGLGWYSSWTLPVFVGLTLVAALFCCVKALGPIRDYRWLTRQIEARYPELSRNAMKKNTRGGNPSPSADPTAPTTSTP